MIMNQLALWDPYEGMMLGEVGGSLGEMEMNGMDFLGIRLPVS
jgi:hypothetical protein